MHSLLQSHHHPQGPFVGHLFAPCCNSKRRSTEDNNSLQELTSRKENDSKSSRQRSQRRHKAFRILACLLVACVAYQIVVHHILAGMVPDIEIDKTTGRKRVRRRPERNRKIGPDGQYVARTPLDGIVEGHFHLIDIVVPQYGALSVAKYNNVQGIFCVLDWTLQQKDPTRVPLFDDLVKASELCQVTRQSADLWDVTEAARQFDWDLGNATLNARLQKRAATKHIPQPEAQPTVREIAPTALIFHESRCGSTLVANLLASFNPQTTHVYSEAPAPYKALAIDPCPNKRSSEVCLEEKSHQLLVRDVFYMMGRTQRHLELEHNLFYKLQPNAIHYLPLLERALSPQPLPWMYLYRDDISVLQSHFQGSVVAPNSEETNLLGQKKAPKCLEGYGNKQQPALQQLVQAKGRTVESLSKEEYCAANLASLSESAIQHYQQTTQDEQQSNKQRQAAVPHFFINYKQLPDVIWDHVLPTLNIDIKARDIHKMEKVAAMYTQGRTKTTTGKIFTGDAHIKEQNVPPAIVNAAHIFMEPTFWKLQALANATLQSPIIQKKTAEDEEEEDP